MTAPSNILPDWLQIEAYRLNLVVDAQLKLKNSHAMPIYPIKGYKMGAYVDNKWCACKSWRQVVRKRQKLILGPQYRNALHDECFMAVVFGDNAPLLEKILSFSMPSEFEYVINLFTNKIDIKFTNGNLVISN
jgi:hypothetical protein